MIRDRRQSAATDTIERVRFTTYFHPGDTLTRVAKPNSACEDHREPWTEGDVRETPKTLLLAGNGGGRCIDG